MKRKSLTDSLASVFDMNPSKRTAPVLVAGYVTPSTGSDVDAMRADFNAVGDDMRRALKQYGKKS